MGGSPPLEAGVDAAAAEAPPPLALLPVLPPALAGAAAADVEDELCALEMNCCPARPTRMVSVPTAVSPPSAGLMVQRMSISWPLVAEAGMSLTSSSAWPSRVLCRMKRDCLMLILSLLMGDTTRLKLWSNFGSHVLRCTSVFFVS